MNIQKVLMVDDDAHIRRIGELSLTKVGRWHVSLAANGAEALEMVDTQRPDVILLDVMMPGMDGPMTLTRLRESRITADVPVIFMTAKVQTQEVENYLKLGAAGVITKPFDPMRLPQEICQLLSAFVKREPAVA